MVNDLNDNHLNKPKIALEGFKSSALTLITDNPSEELSHSDDSTNNTSIPTGIFSPPPLYTKRPNRLNKMTQFTLVSKQKQSLRHKTNHISTLHPSTVQTQTLPNYSTVDTNPNDYPIDNTSVNNDNENPFKLYSNSNYPFAAPSFLNSSHSASTLSSEHLGAS